MNLKHLSYLKTIDEFHSISKAARYLYLSPQSLSAGIKTLENELGFDLIKSDAHGSSLTEEGKQVALLGTYIEIELEKIKLSYINKYADYNNYVVGTTGVPSVGGPYAALYNEFKYDEKFRNITLQMLSLDNYSDQLLQGVVDIVLCTSYEFSLLEHEHLIFVPLNLQAGWAIQIPSKLNNGVFVDQTISTSAVANLGSIQQIMIYNCCYLTEQIMSTIYTSFSNASIYTSSIIFEAQEFISHGHGALIGPCVINQTHILENRIFDSENGQKIFLNDLPIYTTGYIKSDHHPNKKNIKPLELLISEYIRCFT